MGRLLKRLLQWTEVNGYKIYNGDLMNKIGNNVMTPL